VNDWRIQEEFTEVTGKITIKDLNKERWGSTVKNEQI
jgi:hypothetical protein